jgi:hypothetical protein
MFGSFRWPSDWECGPENKKRYAFTREEERFCAQHQEAPAA